MTTFPMMSYKQSGQQMEQGKIVWLMNLREPWMLEQDWIWGGMGVPYNELENLMSEICKDETIVFHYDGGTKSVMACRDLWRMGYRAVDLVDGMLNYRGKYIDKRPSSTLEQKRDYSILEETDP